MIETIYLMISGMQIFLKPMHPYYKYREVPQQVIQKCIDFTHVNPYERMRHIDEMRIADCFMHKIHDYK